MCELCKKLEDIDPFELNDMLKGKLPEILDLADKTLNAKMEQSEEKLIEEIQKVAAKIARNSKAVGSAASLLDRISDPSKDVVVYRKLVLASYENDKIYAKALIQVLKEEFPDDYRFIVEGFKVLGNGTALSDIIGADL